MPKGVKKVKILAIVVRLKITFINTCKKRSLFIYFFTSPGDVPEFMVYEMLGGVSESPGN